MNSVWKTIVWERVNKYGKWIPYSGEVCQLLEQSFRKNLNSICLGDADILLKPYVVNLKELVQISEETGTKCQVRRLLCDEKSAVANRVVWQWRGDSRGTWHCYSIDIMNCIEDSYKAKKEMVDLNDHFPGYEYKINFNCMVQKNKKTKYHRPIRRISTSPYPVLKVQPDNAEVTSYHGLVDDNICQNQVSNLSHAVTWDAKISPKKNPVVKQVSSFWNRLMGSSDSDSENTYDNSVNCSITKKQCTFNGVVNNSEVGSCASNSIHNDVQNSDPNPISTSQHAIVNGKIWKQPWPPHTPESELKPVPGIEPLQASKKKMKGNRRGRTKVTATAPTNEMDILREFTEELLAPPCNESSEDQVCIICYESLTKGSSYDEDNTVVKLRLCSHLFHKSCIKAMYDSGPKDNHIQCPTCKTIHGIKHGIQPPGTMVYHVLPYSLPGYPECDTIRIIYDIPSGIQGPEHPNPGKRYTARGFPRHCYLPDNEIGRKILRLLVKAWERRLIFTIGSSSTTGEQNTVTWNEIHHKTEFGSNRHGHGYPDSNYFENVIAELAAQGVTETTYAWFPAS